MVECTAVSCIHPDKYNNSVDRIISKEEEREDPRRDSSIYLRVQWCFHILQRATRNPASFQSSRAKKDISTYRINSSTRNTTTTRLIPCHPVQITTRHPPATVSCASKHSTRQNPAIRPLQHKQASSNSTRQKQHSKQQPASTQPLQ